MLSWVRTGELGGLRAPLSHLSTSLREAHRTLQLGGQERVPQAATACCRPDREGLSVAESGFGGGGIRVAAWLARRGRRRPHVPLAGGKVGARHDLYRRLSNQMPICVDAFVDGDEDKVRDLALVLCAVDELEEAGLADLWTKEHQHKQKVGTPTARDAAAGFWCGRVGSATAKPSAFCGKQEPSARDGLCRANGVRSCGSESETCSSSQGRPIAQPFVAASSCTPKAGRMATQSASGTRGLTYAPLVRASRRAAVLRWFAQVTADLPDAGVSVSDDGRRPFATKQSLGVVDAFARTLTAASHEQDAPQRQPFPFGLRWRKTGSPRA